jgi:hypothetical protein
MPQTVSDAEVQSKKQLLTQRREALLREDRPGFQPGEFVRWKEGLKTKRRPLEGEPAVVIEVLKEPIYDPKDEVGSTYFREPLDLILGVLGDEGELISYYFDKRRFERCP